MMQQRTCPEFALGRRFVGRLPHGEDLVAAIENICQETSIQVADFFVLGSVSSATYGSYDQKQQVYVTAKEQAHLEIAACTGNVSSQDGAPIVHAQIILVDQQGNLTGGRLFSETIVFAAEINLQELIGKPLIRVYDETTGLMLWQSGTDKSRSK